MVKIPSHFQPLAYPRLNPGEKKKVSSQKFSLTTREGGASALRSSEQAISLTELSALSSLDTVASALPVAEREARRKAAKRGHDMLDLLEHLRLDLVTGAPLDGDLFQSLKTLAQSEREAFEDETLRDLLDAIETRAAVELAKRGLTLNNDQ